MTDLITADEAIETVLAMAMVQDGYAKKAADPGLKLIHKANAKAQRQVAAAITRLSDGLAQARAACSALLEGKDAMENCWKDARADAEAAQAMVVERVAEIALEFEQCAAPDAIRALAPDAGIKALAELRAERDALMDAVQANLLRPDNMRAAQAEVERAALRARLAEMEGKVAALRDFVEDFAKAKIDALRYSPPHGSSPEDEPDPVVDAETVWAWQSDAKDSLASAPRAERGRRDVSEYHGSATLVDGTRVQLTSDEARAIFDAAMAGKARDEAMMPDSADAISLICRAVQRLGDLGWRSAIYCPKDGSEFAIMEFGSTGIFRANYEGKWPDGHLSFDDCASRPQGHVWKALGDLTEAERSKLAECEESHRLWMDGQARLWANTDLSEPPDA